MTVHAAFDSDNTCILPSLTIEIITLLLIHVLNVLSKYPVPNHSYLLNALLLKSLTKKLNCL